MEAGGRPGAGSSRIAALNCNACPFLIRTGTYLLELSAEEGQSFGAVADRVLVHVGERCGLSLPEGAIGWVAL